MKVWVWGLCGLLLAGCSATPGKKPDSNRTELISDQSEQELLYEKLHSAAYQLEVAADDIQAAFERAVSLRDRAPQNTDLKRALTDLSEFLDSAGGEVSDTPDSPTTVLEVGRDLKSFEKNLKTTLMAATNAKTDLEEAQEILEGMLEVASGETRPPIQDLADLLNQAMEDVNGAIDALSGDAGPDSKP